MSFKIPCGGFDYDENTLRLVKRDGRNVLEAIGGGSALPVYNADDLTAEQKIAFAKEYKRYVALVSDDPYGGEVCILAVVGSYEITWIEDDGCGCSQHGSLKAEGISSDVGWTINITKAQYDEIKAAWEAMVGTEV